MTNMNSMKAACILTTSYHKDLVKFGQHMLRHQIFVHQSRRIGLVS